MAGVRGFDEGGWLSSEESDSEQDAPPVLVSDSSESGREVVDWDRDDDSEGDDDVLEPRQQVPVRRERELVRGGRPQTIQERYLGGVVRGARVQVAQGVDAAGGRVGACQKTWVWNEAVRVVASYGRKEVHALQRDQAFRWLWSVVFEGLRAEWASECVAVRCACLTELHRLFARWLSPRTKDGQCRRSPLETMFFVRVCMSVALLAAYAKSPRRVELVWTKYLPRVVQTKLILKRTQVTEEFVDEFRVLWDLVGDQDPLGTLV